MDSTRNMTGTKGKNKTVTGNKSIKIKDDKN